MKKEDNKKAGKEANKKGRDFETFVAEVCNYYERLYKDREGFEIKKNYFDKDISKKEICDVYFSYKDKNGRIKHTFIQCESGEPKYNKINKQNTSHYSKLKSKFEKKGIDIEEVNKIVCYHEENKNTEEMEEIKRLCQEHNIELKRMTYEPLNSEQSFGQIPFYKLYTALIDIDEIYHKMRRIDLSEKYFCIDENKNPLYFYTDESEIVNFIEKHKDKLIQNNDKLYNVFLDNKINRLLLLTDQWKDKTFGKRENLEIENIQLFNFGNEKNKKTLLVLVKYKFNLFNDGNTEMKINGEHLIYCRKKI